MKPSTPLMWKTDNINLAAYLLYLDHECKGIEWERGAGYFCFTRSEQVLEAATTFMGDEAVVNPKRYSMCFAELKRELFRTNPNPPTRRR